MDDEPSGQHSGGGGSGQEGIAIKASLYRINDNGTNSLVQEFPFQGQLVSEGQHPPPGSAEDPSRPVTSQSESVTLQAKSTESEFVVECRDIQIPLDDSLGLGLYEMVCSISFNNQDFSGGASGGKNHHAESSNTSTICHAFQAVEARPNCYAISELENVRNHVQARIQAYLKDMADAGFSVPGSNPVGSAMGSDSGSLNGQEANALEHIPMDQIYSELRQFDRKITIKAQSLFPSNKIPKGAHIKARIDAIKVVPVELANDPSPEAISQVSFYQEGIEEYLDPLLVYTDSMDTAHFTMTTAFLKVLDDYLEATVKPPLDRTTQLVTLQWKFYLESAPVVSTTAANETAQSSMMLLCEEPLPLLLYPASPLAITPSAMRRYPVATTSDGQEQQGTSGSRTVSVTCSNLVFHPHSALLRIHYPGAKDKEKDAIVLDQKAFRFSENMGKIARTHKETFADDDVPAEPITDGEGSPVAADAAAVEEEEFVKSYNIEVEVPDNDTLTKKWASVLTNADGQVEVIQEVMFSLSLDGTKIPSEVNWAKLAFYSDLSKYALQTAVPKGGFTAGAAIVLQLEVPCPAVPITVRLRGADDQKAVLVAGQLNQSAGANPTIAFALPDAPTIASNPPHMQGKEKLYFADISADQGVTFDLAAQAMIPLK